MAMRWSTAVDVVVSGVEAHIERKSAEASRGRELLYLLKQIGPPERAKSTRGGGRH